MRDETHRVVRPYFCRISLRESRYASTDSSRDSLGMSIGLGARNARSKGLFTFRTCRFVPAFAKPDIAIGTAPDDTRR